MSIGFRVACEHGEYALHVAVFPTRCRGYRTVSDAEALRLILAAHPYSHPSEVIVDEIVDEFRTALQAHVEESEREGQPL